MFTKQVFLPFLLIFTLFISGGSCGKNPSESKPSAKHEIVRHLNKGEVTQALALIDSELQINPDDSDLKFYKASALAMQGGVDIYKLYPLLEFKLFHVPAIQWGELNDQRNPYAKFVGRPGEKNHDDESDGKNTEKLSMAILWGLYESIPLFDKVPALEKQQKTLVDSALDLLLGPTSHWPLKLEKRRRSYISFLAAILFIGHLRKTITFEENQNPLDVLCTFQEQVFVTQFPLLRHYLRLFQYGLQGTEIANKHFQRFGEIFDQMSDEEGELSLEIMSFFQIDLPLWRSRICQIR